MIFRYSNSTYEKLFELYVLKEFKSEFGFLRERACTFVENFGEHDYENQELVRSITTMICDKLSDTKLPVRVMAAIAAPKLLKNECTKEMLKDHVDTILKIYLNLMNDIDLEELIEGLEVIIDRFADRVKQYAVSLTEQLVNVFKRLIEAEDGENEEKEEKSIVAESVLRAILKLFELFAKYDDIYLQMENIITGIIHWGLLPENYDKLFDIIDIIHAIVKHGNHITQKTWGYFGDLISSLIGTDEEILEFKSQFPEQDFEGLGYESLHDYIPVISHYITK
jgi:hypothetical protein